MTINRVVPRWRPVGFVLLHVVALLLFGSWLWGPSRAVWDGIDEAIFRGLNQSLGLGRGWAGMWAVASSRYFDLVMAAILAGFILRANFVFSRVEVRRAFFTVGSLVLILLVLRVGFTGVVDHMGWQRGSPTRVSPDAIRLTVEFPGWKEYAKVKDASSRSFPGDHASVLLLWGIFLTLFARGWRMVLPLLVALALSLPRLVAGAHWFTDVVVGGTLLALLAIAWGYCTPGALWISRVAERVCRPVFVWLEKVPGLAGRSFFYRE